MKVAAVIQARMKSTRLPGKVLMEVAGRPILLHIVDRLRRARLVDEIAITTSTEPEDDAIVACAKEHGITVVRGPEDDVLMRFELAAEALDPDIIVRVTGDSPLIDPWFIDYLVSNMKEGDVDFLMLEDGVKCIQEGVDPFSRRALDVLMRRGRNDPIALEHVTGWLKLHPEAVRVRRIKIPPVYEFSGARLSIDTPADLRFLEAIAERLDLRMASLVEVAALLKREPWLMTINAHVHQKPMSQQAGTILLRADGGGTLGLGHLMRSVALAQALRDKAGLGVIALAGVHKDANPEAARAVFGEHRIPLLIKPEEKSEEDFLIEEAKRTKARAVVLDVRTSLSRDALATLHALGLKIVVIDDASDRRLAADMAVYPPVPQASELDWLGFEGTKLIGPEWVLLSPRVSGALRMRPLPVAKAPRLLVSMGGSDPMGLTGLVAAACTRALGEEMPIDVVIGPALANKDAITAWMAKLPGIAVHSSPKDIAALYAQASLAIISFGVTAYELAALGVPALYVALTEDHMKSVLGAEALGFGRYVSAAVGLNAPSVARQAARLISSQNDLAKMSAAGRKAIDGRGAERLAAKIGELIAAKAERPIEARPAETLPASRRPAVGE